jgi:hypothetical protein
LELYRRAKKNPGQRFEITHDKTIPKESTDIPNYEIATKGQKQTFTYKQIQEKTNGRALRVSKKESQLIITKNKDAKVERVSHLGFLGDQEDSSGAKELLTTFRINEDGSLRSRTSCHQTFSFGWLGGEKNKSDYQCETLNKDICETLEKIESKNAFSKKFKECSDTLEKYREHQEKLRSMSDDENEDDIEVLEGFASGLKREGHRNFYDLSAEDKTPIDQVMAGYSKALSNCQWLKAQGYFNAIKYGPVKKEKKRDKNGQIQ